MSAHSSSSTAALMAGSALLVAGLGYWSLHKSSKGYEVRDIDDEFDPADMITADEVAQIFDKLFMEMQASFSRLMQQIQQLQMAGQMIPEQQLKGLIKAELERALTIKQKTIIEEQYDMDYDCLEEATWEFLEEENAKVVKAVDRFQKLWENATGEPVSGWRPGKQKEAVEPIGPDETIAAAEKYFAALTECMRTLVNQYKAEGKNLKDPSVQQQLNMDFSTRVSDEGEAALKKEGVTMNQFEASVKFHGNNPTVARALGMLQMKQQQDMMAMGN